MPELELTTIPVNWNSTVQNTLLGNWEYDWDIVARKMKEKIFDRITIQVPL